MGDAEGGGGREKDGKLGGVIRLVFWCDLLHSFGILSVIKVF